MKTLAIAAVLATASTAHADPVAEATSSVAAGAMTGFNPDGRIMAGVTVDAGQRVGRDGVVSLWLHEGFVFGQSDEFLNFSDEPRTGEVFGGRVGAEVRVCTPRDIFCGIAGIDAALQHDSYVQMMTPASGFDAFVSPHIGFELGTQLRLRPTVEVPMGQGLGLQAKLGLAYQW